MAGNFPGGEQGLIKQLGSLNASIATLQSTIEASRNEMKDSFAEARRLREDEERMLKARTASIGNQVAYLRDNVCHCVQGVVR